MKPFSQTLQQLLVISFCLLQLSTFSKAKFDSYTDSLWHTYQDKQLNDSIRHWALADLAWEYCYIHPDSSRALSRIQLKFYEKHKNWIKFKTDALNTIGNSFLIQGNYDSSLIYFQKNEKILLKNKNYKGLIPNYTNIAEVYRNKGNYPMALRYCNKALKLTDKVGNPINDRAILHNNMGAIYTEQDDQKSALKEYQKAAKLFKQLKEERQLANVYNNISIAYQALKDFDRAMSYAEKSLRLRTEMKDSIQISSSLMHFSTMYFDIQKYDSSYKYSLQSFEIADRLNYYDGLAAASSRIGLSLIELNDYSAAIRYCQRGYEISKSTENLAYLQNNCQCLYEAYKLTNRPMEALRYYEEFESIKDTLTNDERTRQIARLSVQYDFDKERAADSIRTADMKKVKDAEILAQKSKLKEEETFRYSLYGGLFLVIVFGLFMYNRFTVTRRQKKLIELQKHEVEKQKELVDEKNKEILDSINYAKRLQDAILPPMKLIKEFLNESFILYKPKDIVAGDFYFIEPVDGKIVFAAADCTGHGVPGAMVSVVCANALNRAVKEFHLLEPGLILDKVRELILETFEKSENEVKDGMDISLCVLDLNSGMVSWSGANNPMWIVRNSSDVIEEIKPDKQPVGKSPQPKPFLTHQLHLEKGDSVYLFTDGYEDQFGGEKGKKFKSSKMKELILSVKDEKMEKQRQHILQTFEEWKGDLEQVDDVCIIGVKI